MSKEIGERLRSVRGDVSQSDFADRLGISLSSWRRYESGERDPDAETLVALHEKVGVNPLWILCGKRESAEAEMARLVNTAGIALATEQGRIAFEWQGQLVDIDPMDYHWVPVFDVEFGAGNGGFIDFNEPPKAWDAYRKSWLAGEGLIGHQLLKAGIRGVSMFPKLDDGSMQLFDASDKLIRSGEIFGVRIGEELICKYLRHLPGGLIEVRSENPAPEYSPFTIRADQLGEDVQIVGRVVLKLA